VENLTTWPPRPWTHRFAVAEAALGRLVVHTGGPWQREAHELSAQCPRAV